MDCSDDQYSDFVHVKKDNYKDFKARVLSGMTGNHRNYLYSQIYELMASCYDKYTMGSLDLMYTLYSDSEYILSGNKINVPDEKPMDICHMCRKVCKCSICSGCNLTRYCSTECQKLDYQVHKEGCHLAKKLESYHELSIDHEPYLIKKSDKDIIIKIKSK